MEENQHWRCARITQEESDEAECPEPKMSHDEVDAKITGGACREGLCTNMRPTESLRLMLSHTMGRKEHGCTEVDVRCQLRSVSPCIHACVWGRDIHVETFQKKW